MSLFGLLGDFDDDAIFGSHLRQMRQMNSMMNSMNSMSSMSSMMIPDPFNMLTPFGNDFGQRNAGALLGFPSMPNMNRLLNNPDMFGGNNGAAYCSSSVVSMTSGPDGRPHVYQATSSTKTGPGGIRETRKTVQDSRNGLKKMAIGHHIGERAHIIEREQNLRSGQNEERQEFINLDEEEADDFNREFTNKSRSYQRPVIEMIEENSDPQPSRSHRNMLAIEAPPPRSNNEDNSLTSATEQQSTLGKVDESTLSRGLSRNIPKPRRHLRTPTTSSPLALNSSAQRSIHSHPYSAVPRRNYRSKQQKHQSHYDD